MSLVRSLTKRYMASSDTSQAPSMPSRAASKRYGTVPIDRTKISLPTELISTTNVLAYDAPDIHDIISNSSSSSSTKSYDDSDRSPTISSSSSISTPELSRESSPVLAEPNHLSAFFQPRASIGSRQSNMSSDSDVPAVPSRALSHTKKSHQALAHKRSISRLSGAQSGTVSPPNTVRSSLDMFSSKVDGNHPFEAELAQVNELAEEFGVKDVTIWDEEERFLVENGFQKFGVDDYVFEIQGLFGSVFDDKPFPMSNNWI